MREILFRGKRNDNGEWIEGYLSFGDRITIVRKCYDFNNYYVGDSVEEYRIDKNTVGQFTGLTDKNGKKIFEGDIVKYDNGFFEVSYYAPHMAFYFHGLHGRGGVNGFTRTSNNFEVIGNIHDTPELLEMEI